MVSEASIRSVSDGSFILMYVTGIAGRMQFPQLWAYHSPSLDGSTAVILLQLQVTKQSPSRAWNPISLFLLLLSLGENVLV